MQTRKEGRDGKPVSAHGGQKPLQNQPCPHLDLVPQASRQGEVASL